MRGKSKTLKVRSLGRIENGLKMGEGGMKTPGSVPGPPCLRRKKKEGEKEHCMLRKPEVHWSNQQGGMRGKKGKV